MNTTPSHPSVRSARPHRRRRLAAGVLVGAALAVAVPMAASAHVHVTPSESAAGTTTTLAFSFSHGCEQSPTTALVIDIPAGVTHVVPVAQGGWTIERRVAGDGTVERLTYRADTPVENGIKGEVAFDARFGEDLADSSVAFPVTQECVTGSTAWTQVAEDGATEPESPAPVVSVGAVVAEGDEHGHGGSAHAADPDAAATTSATPDVTAVWLGGAGLGLGAIALIVAIAAFVRRRA